jgi:group I intron endonuclease
MSEKQYLIYKLTSPSGKHYIGQTCNYKNRMNLHKLKSSSCRALKHAIVKHGFDNFAQDILESGLTVDEANNREQYYITSLNSMVPNGYNLTSGGLNYIRSDETKKLKSIMQKGKKRNPDHVAKTNKNPEKIRKTAEAHRGMKRSDEARQNMSIARKKLIATNGGALNKGMKTFFNPENHDELIQCLPEGAPVNWVQGNPKMKNRAFYQNIISGEVKRLHKESVDLQQWRSWNVKVDLKKVN